MQSTLLASKQKVKKSKTKYTYTDMPDYDLIGQSVELPSGMKLDITKASCQDQTGKIYLDKASYVIQVNGKARIVWISMADSIDGIETE